MPFRHSGWGHWAGAWIPRRTDKAPTPWPPPVPKKTFQYKFTFEISFDGTTTVQDATQTGAQSQFEAIPAVKLITEPAKAVVTLLDVSLVPSNG